ncbi:MAG: hypothetical protein ACM3ZT_12715 [Bacillota bacterium]
MNTEPANSPALEQALMNFEDSVDGRRAVLKEFVAARIYVLLDRPWDGRSLPNMDSRLLFVSDGENMEQAMLAVFTDKAKAETVKSAMGEFQHAVEVDAKWALLGVPPGMGVRINPNVGPSFRILPELVTELRKQTQHQLAQRMNVEAKGAVGKGS